MKSHRVTFKLFKSTSPNQPHPYVGSVEIDGKWYAIEAWVVEPSAESPQRHFEGMVSGGKALARQLVKSAKERAPSDLLKALEDKPWDDVEALRAAIPLSSGSGGAS